MTETETGTLYCYVHPSRATSLRCNNCERPICASCAIRTPTGYRCRECVRGQQKVFDTSHWVDFIFGFLAAAVPSLLASLLVSLIGGFGFFMFLILGAGASAVGAGIAEAARFATRKHRSRALFLTVAAGMVIGALPVIALAALRMDAWGLIAQAIYLVVGTPVMYTRLSGLRLFR